MRSKLVTVCFKIPLEEFQDYTENLRELGVYHHSEDLRGYVMGFNRSFGVDVRLKRNNEKVEALQKENKLLVVIKKKKLDKFTNQASKEVGAYLEKFDVIEGEVDLPNSDEAMKEIARIQAKTRIEVSTLVEMFESKINEFRDDRVKEELLDDVACIREKHHILKEGTS